MREELAIVEQEALTAYELGEYATAAARSDRLRELQRQVLGERHPHYAASLNNLAGLYLSMGDYAQAEPLYRQALEIRKDALGERHPLYATSLNNLGGLYESMGDYAQAEPLYRQALEIKKDVLGERHPGYATSLNNLAALYRSMGDYAQAEPLYRQALEIWKDVLGERHPSYATSLNNLAALYESMGDYARAEPLCRQALEIRREVLGERHPLYASSLNDLAAVYHSMGDYARAEPLYRQALEIRKDALGERHPDYAASLNNLAALYRSMGDYAQAEPLYRQGLEIRKDVLGERHPDYAANLHNLALLYESMGDYAQAEPLYRQALDVTLELLSQLAGVQSERQQLLTAAELRYRLDSWLSATLRHGEGHESAVDYVLATKGTILARQRALRILAEAEPDLFRDYQQTASRLATLALATPEPQQREAWERQIRELSEDKERLEADLARRVPGWREATEPVTAADLQALLDPDTVLVDVLEYTHTHWAPPAEGGKWQTERRLLAFLLRAEGPVRVVELGAAEPIAQAIDQWRLTYGLGPEGAEAGRSLREALWLPLEEHLDGVQLVIVSPDGALGRFPLAALPGREEGHYLIEDYAIACVPSLQLLPALLAEGELPDYEGGLLALGNINYDEPEAEPQTVARDWRRSAEVRWEDRARFQHLDGTEGEIASLKKTFDETYGEGAVLLLQRSEAGEAAFRSRAGRYRYLHIATHGYFAPPDLRSPLAPPEDERMAMQLLGSRRLEVHGRHPGLLSGLALAGANLPPRSDQEDGILTAEEISSLNLGAADLVVLSACETGLGQSAGGEGLIGIQRAFQAAGARTTVASLWKVDDIATQVLMEEFYRNLWTKKMGKLEALRQAQLAMLRRYDPGKQQLSPRSLTPIEQFQDKRIGSPYYWAAFTLSGDWR